MASLPQVLNYKDHTVRMLIIDGEPWWVAKDVCDVLEIANSRDAVARLDEDEKGVAIIDTLGGPQEMLIVNEPGLYSLILTSRKPEAKTFKRWITHEVLPQLRQTGTYSVQPVTPIQALQQAVNILAEQEKRLKAAEEKMKVLQYRVENLDAANIEGDLQQRLNRMVRKYAFKTGIMHNIAWEHFKQAYNTAFRTNLELLINNYAEREGIKKLTIPQYLAVTGKLEDALRVADKMLNDVVREA